MLSMTSEDPGHRQPARNGDKIPLGSAARRRRLEADKPSACRVHGRCETACRDFVRCRPLSTREVVARTEGLIQLVLAQALVEQRRRLGGPEHAHRPQPAPLWRLSQDLDVRPSSLSPTVFLDLGAWLTRSWLRVPGVDRRLPQTGDCRRRRRGDRPDGLVILYNVTRRQVHVGVIAGPSLPGGGCLLDPPLGLHACRAFRVFLSWRLYLGGCVWLAPANWLLTHRSHASSRIKKCRISRTTFWLSGSLASSGPLPPDLLLRQATSRPAASRIAPTRIVSSSAESPVRQERAPPSALVRRAWSSAASTPSGSDCAQRRQSLPEGPPPAQRP